MSFATMERGVSAAQKVVPLDPALWENRLRFLDPTDRTILELWIHNKASGRQIAKLRGVHPGVIHRRLRRFMESYRDPVVACLCDPNHKFTPLVRRIGLLHHLLGHSRVAISRQLDLPVAQVNAHLAYLDGFVQALRK